MKRFYHAISYLFFPGTMAVIGACFPYSVYSGMGPLVSWQYYFGPALATFLLIPSLGVWLMKTKGWITDFHVYKRKERNLSYPLAIIPAMLLALYYFYNRVFWGERFPYLWAASVTLVLCLLWITNAIWLKASAHMAGMGGFLFLTIFLFQRHGISPVWISIALLLTGVVYAARHGLSAHSHIELIAGFCLGFIVTFAVFSL